MVSAAYDHLVAIIVVGVLFIGTVVSLPFSTLQTVDQQQLRNTALNVFDSMLLDVGSPSNWGSILSIDNKGNAHYDPTTATKFGLAYADPFSKFVLDPDKVQRLNAAELSYERVRELLNLQDYGFQFTIYRPFKVASTLNITESSVHFSVSVMRSEDGTPIPNADVKVTTFVTAMSTKNVSDYIHQPIDPYHGTTDVAGNCEDTLYPDLGDYAVKYAVAIMEITVGGMSTTVVARNDVSNVPYLKMNTYGDKVVLSIRNENLTWDDVGANRQLLDVEAYDSKTLYQIPFDDKNINWGGKNATIYLPGIRAVNPTVLLCVIRFILPATPGIPGSGGPTPILVAGPFSFADSGKIFEFGGDSTSENPITTMRRLVVISDMTYVAAIAFWRE